MSDRIAFIDMDGVLCDFHHGVSEVFDRPELMKAWPAGEYRCHVAMSIDEADFWKRIETRPSFWLYLRCYPWARNLIEAVESAGYRPIICTAPTHDPACAAQKTQWLQAHFGRGRLDYFLGSQKHLLAQPGRILIDDSDKNCEAFAAAGGHSILFPQRWNSLHQIEDGFAAVRYELEALQSVRE